MAAEKDGNFQRQKRPMLSGGNNEPPPDHAIVVTYKDGTRGTVLKIGNTSDRWNFACKLRGQKEPVATAIFNGPWGNRNLFAALTNAVLHFFKSGESPYPVERTLMAGGAIDAAMHSHHAGRRRSWSWPTNLATTPRFARPARAGRSLPPTCRSRRSSCLARDSSADNRLRLRLAVKRGRT
jgi:hypothetical protein